MKTYSDLDRSERVERVMQSRRGDLCLVLEDLSEDLNISAILRTAEGFGVGLVCVIYTGDKPKISKGASAGAYKWLKVRYYRDGGECIAELRKEGFTVVGAVVDPEAKVLREQDFTKKVAIVVGNESRGLSEGMVGLVDEMVYIPMYGLTESLNVSVAAGIFLYEAVRQKRNIGGEV